MRENVTVSDSVPENMVKPFACRSPYKRHIFNSNDRLQPCTKNWPVKEHVATREMTDADFYYLSDSDQVICFYCGRSLKNWKPNDNPWYEPEKWFPLSEYVLKKQGMDYVKGITLKYTKLNRPKLKNPCKANDEKNYP